MLGGEAAQAHHATRDAEAARRKPFVGVCDAVPGDTSWPGGLIARHMSAIVDRLTAGQGAPCATRMEDNATLTALARGAQAGRLDAARTAVRLTAPNLDRAAPEQTAAEAPTADSGGFGPPSRGPLMDEFLSRTLLLSKGDPSVLLARPIGAGLLALAVVPIAGPSVPAVRRKREDALHAGWARRAHGAPRAGWERAVERA